MDICSSPQLIAAYHVFRRLSVPRHPPYALYSLTLQIWKRSELIDESVLNACIHKLIYWLIRNHLRSKGYEENEVFRITAANRPSFIILKMMYSVTSFGFRLISQPGLFLGLTYDLSVYVAPRMSKHYLKQCFIRYFNMQFSKNNVVSDFGIIKLRWMLAFISCFIVTKTLAACQWATSSAWSFDHISY